MKTIALLSAFGLLVSCARPEGIAMDRPADGRIDDLERVALLRAVATGIHLAQDDPILLGLWNDFRVARWNRLAPMGINPRQNGLHLRLFDAAAESSARHIELFGHDQSHFFRRSTRTIYSFSDELPGTWGMLLHEAGHDLGATELTAEANRLHGLIFTLCLDPAAGAALVLPGADGRSSPLLTRWMPGYQTTLGDLDAYSLAVLVFLREAVLRPDALDLVLRDLKALSDAEVRDYVFFGLPDPADARSFWIASFWGLFASSSFGDYLDSVVLQRGGEVEASRQLLLYLRIVVEDLKNPVIGYATYLGQVALMDEMLDRTEQHGMVYPDLQNRIADVLGSHYSAAAADATPLGQRDAYARVLGAHAHLPCRAEPWACPEPYDQVRPRQLEAYQGLVQALIELEDVLSTFDVIDEFLERFYPDDAFDRADTLGALLPLLRAGIASALLVEDFCKALGYAERYARAACYSQPDPAQCAADHPFDWDVEEALRRDELEDLQVACPSANH